LVSFSLDLSLFYLNIISF